MDSATERRQDSHLPPEISAELTRILDTRENHCFGCGPENPEGLKLEFVIDTTDASAITASAIVTLTRRHEGPPGHIHGGIIATLLDEAMSKLNRPLNLLAMTRSLSVDYLKPSPLYIPLRLVAKHVKLHGRKVLHTADLMLEDGTVLAHGEGFFSVDRPEPCGQGHGGALGRAERVCAEDVSIMRCAEVGLRWCWHRSAGLVGKLLNLRFRLDILWMTPEPRLTREIDPWRTTQISTRATETRALEHLGCG